MIVIEQDVLRGPTRIASQSLDIGSDEINPGLRHAPGHLGLGDVEAQSERPMALSQCIINDLWLVPALPANVMNALWLLPGFA